MKYETPELTALTPAIDAIRMLANKGVQTSFDGSSDYEGIPGYQDWES